MASLRVRRLANRVYLLLRWREGGKERSRAMLSFRDDSPRNYTVAELLEGAPPEVRATCSVSRVPKRVAVLPLEMALASLGERAVKADGKEQDGTKIS